MTAPDTSARRITTEDELREVVGYPSDLVRSKAVSTLEAHARAFIALSPLVVVATADREGRVDASPRGDPPGFVQVLDERTLLLPDRKGNKRIDTFRNIAQSPYVGLLFLVPGMTETLRVNGRAAIVSDAELLDRCAVDGKTPKLGIRVDVEELYFHCARSFLRGRVWQEDTWPARDALPTLGKMLAEQARPPGLTADEIDRRLEASNRDLY